MSANVEKALLNIPNRPELTPSYIRKIVSAVNNILIGKMNNTGDITLTANDTTTTITDSRVGADSAILIMPTTANAAGAIATTYITPANGSFVVTHANNAQTDRTFKYAING